MLSGIGVRFDGTPDDVRTALLDRAMITVYLPNFTIEDPGDRSLLFPSDLKLLPAPNVATELQLSVFPHHVQGGAEFIDLRPAGMRFRITAVTPHGLIEDVYFLDFNPCSAEESRWSLTCTGLPDCQECSRDKKWAQVCEGI